VFFFSLSRLEFAVAYLVSTSSGAKLIWENKLSVREPPFEVYSTAKRYVPRAANEAQKDLEVEELEFGRQEVQSQVVTVPNTHEYHPIERTVF